MGTMFVQQKKKEIEIFIKKILNVIVNIKNKILEKLPLLCQSNSKPHEQN